MVLYLLRHGEAAPGDRRSGDFGRTLTPEGKSRIERLARLLNQRKVAFGKVLVSPAKRTMETMFLFESVLGAFRREEDDNLYEGSPSDLLRALTKQGADIQTILLIGHNPGISALASFLSGEEFISLQPGMMAVIDFGFGGWDLLSSKSGVLKEILQ